MSKRDLLASPLGMKKYQTLLAGRYLRSRAVNLIAIAAVTLGVAALIIVTSVMDGFARDIQARLRGIMSHIVIEGGELVGIADYERVIHRVEKVPQVEACAPLVECPFALIRINKETRFVQLRGIDLEREKTTSEIESYLGRLGEFVSNAEKELRREGQSLPPALRRKQYEYMISRRLVKTTLDFDYERGARPERPGALVGSALATAMGLRPGDRISVTAPTTILTFQTQDFDIVGGFRCGHYTYDSQLLYVPIEVAQDLLGLLDRVTSISVRLGDIRRKEEAKKAIIRAIRNPTRIVDPADPKDAARIRLASKTGRYTTEAEGEIAWLRLEPTSAGPATLVIMDVAPVLARADEPTALALDVRSPADGPRPRLQIVLVDSDGRRYFVHPDPDRSHLVAPPADAEGPVAFTRGLVNFVSANGLDAIDPEAIDRIEFEVRGGPVEFANLRFEDTRRLSVMTWYDKQRQFLKAVDVERVIQAIIMGLMVVIAGFGILAILWLMVREKTRDIGVLMSLGATRAGIVRIYLLNGLLIGLCGAALGLALGWTISAKLNWIEDRLYDLTGWRAFPPDIYYLDKLPHQESPGHFLLMALVAVVVSLIAAVWPAIQAARLDPIEALRYE